MLSSSPLNSMNCVLKTHWGCNGAVVCSTSASFIAEVGKYVVDELEAVEESIVSC